MKINQRSLPITAFCLALVVAGVATIKSISSSGQIEKQRETISLLEKRLGRFEANDGKFEDSEITIKFNDINNLNWYWYFPVSRYFSYKRMSHTISEPREYTNFIMWDDPTIQMVAKDVTKNCKSREHQAQTLLDLVSQIMYRKDPSKKDYVRFPIETLVEGAADCEDTAVLYATLMKTIEQDVVLINFPSRNGALGHTGVGVRGNFSGTYWIHKGIKYYYAETAGVEWGLSKDQRWKIGKVPSNFKGLQAHIYSVN